MMTFKEEFMFTERTEQRTESAKKLMLEDLHSIQEVFWEGKETEEVTASPCCCI